jgi:hypothetical protein
MTYDRTFGDFPVKNAVYTWFWPTLVTGDVGLVIGNLGIVIGDIGLASLYFIIQNCLLPLRTTEALRSPISPS